MAIILSIHLGSEKGAGKQSVAEAQLVAEHGLLGDRHAGRDEHRQLSLFAEEVRRDLEASGFIVPAAELSANLFTQQLALDSLRPGSRLRIGEAEVEITERRQPCRSITRIDNRLPKLLYGRCGQLARVIRGGIIRPGDRIEILPDPRQPSLFT